MKIQNFSLFSISLAGVLLMNLAVGNSGVRALATPNPIDEPAAPNLQLDLAVCDPSAGPFSTQITNPYLPLAQGRVWLLKGVEDGANLRLRITVLNQTEVVAGVTTQVVEEREWEDGELIEVSRNFFVQAPDGTVCYYGEDVDMYENGQVVSHEGAWRAGEGNNRPGIIMPANPAVGMTYAQEVAPGIAEDQAKVVLLGESVTVPAGTYENTLKTLETTPLEPGSETIKYYAPGVGLIVDSAFELVKVVNSNDNDNDDDDDDENDDDEDDDDDDDGEADDD